MIGMMERETDSLAAEVDAMWESAAAREWEELNDSADETQWLDSIRCLELAKDAMYDAVQRIAEASDELGVDPEAYRTESLLDDAETLLTAVKDQIEKMKRRDW